MSVTNVGRRLLQCLLVCVLCAWPVGTSAQANRGRLLVTVTDVTGAVLPGADVRVVGLENATKANVRPAVKTTDAGLATLDNLVLGRYSIEAEFSGFEKGVIKDVRVRAGDNRQTIALPLRGLTDEVTVGRDRQEAGADRGVSFGTALTREQIDALSEDPDELRQQLMEMAGPGATIAVDSFEGAQLPPKSQIRSIRIARDQFAAENHAAGIGRIEIITQPGSGPIRGNIGTSFYNSALDGKNPLVARKGPAESRNLNLGIYGTLIKDKASFSLYGGGGTSYSTPVLAVATPDGTVYRNAALRTPSDNNSFYAYVDYALTRDQTLRFNVNRYGNGTDNQGVGVNDDETRAYSSDSATTSFYLQQTGPLGRRFALNSRLSYSMSDQDFHSRLDLPTTIITDARNLGGAQRTGGTASRSVNIASDLDYVRGFHSVRVGLMADLYRYRSDANQNYLGTYTFESQEAFEARLPRSYTRRIGDPNISYTNAQFGLYVQDDIRLRKNLTISPGLRYEAQTHVPDRLNLAPRFGMTWSPFASGRTTIRASAGIFYDWLPTATYQQTLQIDGFRQREVNIPNPSYPDPGELGAAPPTNRYLLADGMIMPKTSRLSLGLAHTFNARYSLNAVYADTRGSALLVGRNLNAPIDGVRPDPEFANVIEAISVGESRLKSLNTNVAINLGPTGPNATGGPLFAWRRGLRLGLSYTLASSENNTDGAFSPPASGVLATEWGPAPGDVRHRGTLSISTTVVRGLTASFNFNGASAAPLTIRTGLDDNGDLIFNDRPDGVGRNTARTVNQYNSSAFFSYSIPLGSRTVAGQGGISITSAGGGLVVNQSAPQATARYRLNFNVNVSNLLNRANYSGFSGVMTSPFFLKPQSATGTRRVNFNVGLSF